jgi:hypothetical protein
MSSQAIPFPTRSAIIRTIQGTLLCAAFGGLGACGSESAIPGSAGSPGAPESSDDDQAVPESSDSTQPLSSGQSGTEYDDLGGGLDRPACPCGWLENPLRATVLEVVGHIEGADFRPLRLGTVRLRVEELLGSTTGLEIGSEITSPWFGELPCFYGCASIAVGDEVLAFYRFPKPCVDTTGDDCSNGDTIPGNIALTPWSDTVVLAQLANGDLTLPVQDIAVLESPECDGQIVSVHAAALGGPNEAAPACYERESPP